MWCTPGWNNTLGQPGLGTVTSIVNCFHVHNGILVAGGSFEGAVARWNGSSWQVLGGGLHGSFSGPTSVYAMTSYDGNLVVVGNFLTAQGVDVHGIARWTSRGWQPFGSGAEEPVDAVVVYRGQLIAEVGDENDFIHAWNGLTWEPLPGNVDAVNVSCMTVYNDELIIGGALSVFTEIDGEFIASGLARWNGVSWQAVGDAGVQNVLRVSALGVYNGELIIGGRFSSVGDVDALNVARWDGDEWRALGSGIGTTDFFSPNVYALHEYNGTLVVGGTFAMAGGLVADGLARWDADEWSTFGDGADVYGLSDYQNGLVVGGSFSQIGNLRSNDVVMWIDCPMTCIGDVVENGSFLPPGDGTVDGADLAYVLSQWGVNPGSPADLVDSGTFQPPPDGIVDGADLGVLLTAWGMCP